MTLTVIGTDRKGNPINTLSDPDTIKELEDFLTEVYYQSEEFHEANEMRTA